MATESSSPSASAGEALIGGVLCLDFANTVGSWADRKGTEKLRSYGDVLRWAMRAGACDARSAARLRRTAARQPAQAQAAHARALRFRNAMYDVLRAYADEQRLPARPFALLNRELAAYKGTSRLVANGARFDWQWNGSEDDLSQILWPVAQSLSVLMTSDDLKRVGHCLNEDCGWLFVDASRNGSRRWCSMRDCGNRAKVNRFNARRRMQKNTAMITRR